MPDLWQDTGLWPHSLVDPDDGRTARGATGASCLDMGVGRRRVIQHAHHQPLDSKKLTDDTYESGEVRLVAFFKRAPVALLAREGEGV